MGNTDADIRSRKLGQDE